MTATCRARARSSTTTFLSTRCSTARSPITKTTPALNVTRGQLVPYTITVRNAGEMPLLRTCAWWTAFRPASTTSPGSARIDDVADRAHGHGPRARLERPRHRTDRRAAHCHDPARGRRWRQRRRVRESRAGRAYASRAGRSRVKPPRRCESCRIRPSTAPTSPARCSTTPIATASRNRARRVSRACAW